MTIAIIPARGGSKRIPRKNIKEFYGKPIIAYAIEAAIQSECFLDVIVSSDDDEILNIGRHYGARGVRRSDYLCGDTIGTTEVLLDFLGRNNDITNLCCIYPCSPFITPEKLIQAQYRHIEIASDSLFPVVKYSYPPQRALRINKSYRAEMLKPKYYAARSQDLEPIYHDAGQFYWLNVKALKAQQKLFMKRSIPLIYPETEVQDIDTLEDWVLAEVKYQLWRNKSESSLLGLEQRAQ